MSASTKSAMANTIIAGMFLAMITGIASWNVNAINNNTKAVKSNTEMVYTNGLEDEKRHNELSGLVLRITYDLSGLRDKVTIIKSQCDVNTKDIAKYKFSVGAK